MIEESKVDVTAADVLDHLKQGLVLLDAKGTVLLVNQAARALFFADGEGLAGLCSRVTNVAKSAGKFAIERIDQRSERHGDRQGVSCRRRNDDLPKWF